MGFQLKMSFLNILQIDKVVPFIAEYLIFKFASFLPGTKNYSLFCALDYNKSVLILIFKRTIVGLGPKNCVEGSQHPRIQDNRRVPPPFLLFVALPLIFVVAIKTSNSNFLLYRLTFPPPPR